MSTTKSINLTQLAEQFHEGIDIFIGSMSFEDRCKKILENLNKDKIKQVLIFRNKELFEIDNETTNANTKDLNLNFGNKLKITDLDKNYPISLADKLTSSILEANTDEHQTIVVDITTFTHEALLMLFKILTLLKTKAIFLIYNSANNYSYTSKYEEDKWLSKGIQEIRTVLGYPGKFHPQNKLHLMVLVGYEADRSSKLIEAYEPSRLSLGLGCKEESVNKELFSLNEKMHETLLNIYSNVSTFTFSCIDAVKTKSDILTQVNSFPGHNIVIAPMNNKISTIGASLAAIERPEIQLCYASANIYNTNAYSLPSDDCFIIDFSSLNV